MDASRLAKYEELADLIGKTQLVPYEGSVPNNNRILLKRECDNPFGSHYDRVYLALFHHWETIGRIKPGLGVFETTSGSAGVSFAGIGRILGYECHVAIPEGGEIARERAIMSEGATLYRTPAEAYVNSFPDWIVEFRKRTRYFCLNHSMHNKANNEWTLHALEDIAKEAVSEAAIDCFLPAVGNGSSLLGPGRIFKANGTLVVAFEPFQSAVCFERRYPGRYVGLYGIQPGTLSRHRIPGTSYPGIDFPHIASSITEGVLDDVLLISDRSMDAEYFLLTGRCDPEQLPHWDDPSIEGHTDVGRSTRAGLAAALSLSKHIENKTIMVIAYDKIERYDV